jgi:uncharacterized protein (TIGR00369 family)
VTHARPTAAELSDYARRVPFNRWLDLQVLEANETGVELLIPWREELGGALETLHVHGGVLACIVDIAVGLGALAALGHGGPTVDLRTDFMRGAVAGPLRAAGRIQRAGRTLVFVDVSIRDARGEVVATGRGVSYVGGSRQMRPAGHSPPPA